MQIPMLAQQLPGESTVNAALNADPTTIIAVTVLSVSIAMVIGAISVLLIIRWLSKRSDTDGAVSTALISALSESFDVRDSTIAKEIRDGNAAMASTFQRTVSTQEDIAKTLALLEVSRRDERSLLSKIESDIANVDTHQTTFDDALKQLKREFEMLSLWLKGAIEDMNNVKSSNVAQMETIAELVLKAIERLEAIGHEVHAINEKVKTQELPKVVIPPAEPAAAELAQ